MHQALAHRHTNAMYVPKIFNAYTANYMDK